MRLQKLDKLCRGYTILRPRLTKYWRLIEALEGLGSGSEQSAKRLDKKHGQYKKSVQPMLSRLLKTRASAR